MDSLKGESTKENPGFSEGSFSLRTFGDLPERVEDLKDEDLRFRVERSSGLGLRIPRLSPRNLANT